MLFPWGDFESSSPSPSTHQSSTNIPYRAPIHAYRYIPQPAEEGELLGENEDGGEAPCASSEQRVCIPLLLLPAQIAHGPDT